MQTTEGGVVDPERIGVETTDAGQISHEPRESDARFQVAQRCADADMRSVAKRKRRSLVAREVEPIGIGKSIRVAVARPDQQQDVLAAPDRAAVQRKVLARAATRELHRAVVTQQLP